MFNERGGINGRKVEFLLADIPTPTAAISETERLTTKEGVKITLGSGVSLLAIPVSQAAERHGVFHWETAGAADIITKRGFKYTFQVGPAAYRYGQAAVDITLDELAPKLGKTPANLRVALLWENRAFGKSVGDSIRAYAKEKNINLVYDEGYDQFLTDMQDPVAAAAELRRCVRERGFVGGHVATNVRGTYLPDEAFRPIFEAASELDVPLFLHPVDPPGRDRTGDYELTVVAGYLFDSTINILRMICSNFLDRYG